ncbi:MAG TPA: glycosyltransferase family 4 protein [Vicinamibacterales bacterium]|nr:glycosyltransferase family 4 protein [Vicinamibacterales bacterium]
MVCWAGMQGYIASCLRQLGSLDGVELHVVYLDFRDLPLREDLLAGVSNTRLIARDANAQLTAQVEAYAPDVVLLCGWFYRPYRRLLRSAKLQSSAFVLGMDTPWVGSWKQQFNRLRLASFVRRLDRVVVAGSQSRELAVKLGVPAGRIRTGLYGFDFSAFAAERERLNAAGGEWPRRFLFAGRYVAPKGLGVLVDAYRRYRRSVPDPWPLHVCGAGPEAWRFASEEGVVDLGYVQPSALPDVFGAHGVFVLPSLHEPWGVALAEAAATGLPLICTAACGAAEQLLDGDGNGIKVVAGDPAALAGAMAWMHQHVERLPSMGARSADLARQHSASAWATRMVGVFQEVLVERGVPISAT